MIILRDVPFERQARFLHDNVCPYPEGPEFDRAMSECTATIDKVSADDLASGLRAYGDLLRGIYADVTCVEGKDDQAKYRELVNTIAFMYACFAFGALDSGDRLLIDKETLQQHYKKGGITRKKRHLEHHGLAIDHLSTQGEAVSQRKATQLALSYDGHPALVPALRVFAGSIASLPVDGQKPLYNRFAIFAKADYEAAILRVPIPRDSLDPLRTDILHTVGDYRREWTDLVHALRDRCGLQCSGFWHYGASPSWSVSFAAQGKKPLAIFCPWLEHRFHRVHPPIGLGRADYPPATVLL
jgi:hypothetical protein